MKDIMGMMKNLQGMQAKMQEFQHNLDRLEVEGRAGGGMVTVTMNGKGELRALRIDPSLFKEDSVEVLEDLIVTAHNDAKQKTEAEVQAKMAEMTAGLPIPPGMKLPF